jgi:hypothetical protein
MDFIQTILVYGTLLIAVGYLAKKFILPKRLFASKKNTSRSCGQEDCGCH